MLRIAVANHENDYHPGRLAPFLAEHDTTVVQAGVDDFPGSVDAAVVLGGIMGAYDVDDHPWLVEEKSWIAALVEEDVPVLGICLGSQLIADALGGRAYQAATPEIGVVNIELTAAGASDDVVAVIGKRGLFAHRDTFDLPPGAVLLAAFRARSALAIQSHPETPPDEAVSWLDGPDFDLVVAAGRKPEDYAEEVREHADELAAAAGEMFSRWFSSLAARRGPSR